MKVDLEELERKARAVFAWHDRAIADADIRVCVACDQEYTMETGDEETPLCHGCAHEMAGHTFALVARIRELEGALEYTLDGQGAAWTNRLHDLLAKGVVLP